MGVATINIRLQFHTRNATDPRQELSFYDAHQKKTNRSKSRWESIITRNEKS